MTGNACQNVRRALRYLNVDLVDSDIYDICVYDAILELQRREGHEHKDGLTGRGTRALLVRTLLRGGGERVFSQMTYPKGQAFPRVFVSYAKEDQGSAEHVVDFLIEHGVELWVDYRSLQPGEKWPSSIEYAISSSRYFLALLSRCALNKRGVVQSEFKTALSIADQYPDKEIFVIPARLEECDVSDTRFAELQYFDLFPNPDEGLSRLVDFLAENWS